MTRTDELRRQAVTERTPSDARALLTASLGEDPYELIEALRGAGERKAEAVARAHQLQHWRKALLARISTELDDGSTSEAKLDRLARADDRYKKHIGGEAVAIQQKEQAEAEYWRLRDKLEWMRTTVAHLNAMSRLEEPA